MSLQFLLPWWIFKVEKICYYLANVQPTVKKIYLCISVCLSSQNMTVLQYFRRINLWFICINLVSFDFEVHVVSATGFYSHNSFYLSK